MVKLERATVNISVDNEQLEEYKTEKINHDHIKCYVPSEAGKKFEIIVEDKRKRRAELYVNATLYIDGHKVDVRYTVPPNEQRVISGIDTNEPQKAMFFTFSTLEVTDDDDAPMDAEKLGTITVKLIYATRKLKVVKPKKSFALTGGGSSVSGGGNLAPACEPAPRNAGLVNKAPIHERAKKLASHRVLLTKADDPTKQGSQTSTETHNSLFASIIQTPPPFTITPTRYEYRHKDAPWLPVLTFEFHYASKDLLVAHDIIPANVIEDQDEEENVNDEVTITKVRRSARIRHLEAVREEDGGQAPAVGDDNGFGNEAETGGDPGEDGGDKEESEGEKESGDEYREDDDDDDDDDFGPLTRPSRSAAKKELAALKDSAGFIKHVPASASPKKEQSSGSGEATKTQAEPQTTSPSTNKEFSTQSEAKPSLPTTVKKEPGLHEDAPKPKIPEVSVKREQSDSDSDDDGFNAEERAEFLRLQQKNSDFKQQKHKRRKVEVKKEPMTLGNWVGQTIDLTVD